MKPALQVRLSQHLALTPQLQQSIRLLQLSTLELQQELDQILADNPLLERLDDPLDGALRIAADGALREAPAPSAGDGPGSAAEAAGTEPPREPDGPDGGEADGSEARGLDEAMDWGGDRRNRPEDDDDREGPQVAAPRGSLAEHLGMQLAATPASARDKALVGLLIDALDDDGLLDTDLAEIAAMLPEELDIDPGELQAALRLLQSFDPPGVGARNLGECLALQLDALPRRRWPSIEGWEAARGIVDGHLELLASRDWVRLKRLLKCDDEALREAQALIRSLDPRPGSAWSTDLPAYVAPDVVARRTRRGWIATLNGDVMPRLRVNEMYARILREKRGGGMSSQLQEARWLVKNVQQRFETILRVAQAIVDRQQGFFSHGAVAMRPLVLREIAEVLGLHESTVSRVTTQKYLLTPFGTFELKYFFGSHVATEAGGAASSTAIRALLKQLIGAEDPRRPLSDSRLAELLGEQGFVVARRTVAKYRETLRIPAVAQRRAL